MYLEFTDHSISSERARVTHLSRERDSILSNLEEMLCSRKLVIVPTFNMTVETLPKKMIVKKIWLTVMKMGSSNKSDGVSKKFRKNVCREEKAHTL